MSTDFPDFTTAPAWIRGSVVYAANDMETIKAVAPYALEGAPWTPLYTVKDLASRVDPGQLADVIEVAQWGHHAHSRTTRQAVATAVLAALPDLMGGEQA